jgi:hypothetical protein
METALRYNMQKLQRPSSPSPSQVLVDNCKNAEELRRLLNTNPKFKKTSLPGEPITHECVEIFRDGKWVED